MLKLAAPLALAELGWVAMGLEDAVMAGRLGPAALGAGTLGVMLFYPLAICGTGLLLGMDTLVAQSFGSRQPAECRRILVDGIWLAVALTPLVALLELVLIPVVRAAGVNPSVLALFAPFFKAQLWGILPLLLYTALRRYLQAVDVVKPVTFALVSANIVNIIGNWALMFGHWGMPAMGLEGSGWSTTIARLYMAVVMAVAVWWDGRSSAGAFMSIRPRWRRIRELVQLGLPAGGQILFEGVVFGLVSVMAARLDDVSLAAHSIAINVVSTTYMVPLGISSAAAVRVGQALGACRPRAASARGWAALLLGAAFMGTAGLALALVPRWIVRLYTHDAAVVVSGALLLRIAALFELFDGLQVVATGALRGLGNTHTAMLAHLGGYWAIGLPVAYLLGFHYGWGVAGIWTGLSAALILIGLALVAAWRHAAAAPGTSA
jgi:MATE family multidrug resistance protein